MERTDMILLLNYTKYLNIKKHRGKRGKHN